MTLLTSLSNIGILDAGIVALLGYGVVFLGLILLMLVVYVIGKIFIARDKKAEKLAQLQAPVPPQPPVFQPEAPGSAGSLKLHDVDPKTAAMLMAIVADKMGKPLNQLRFISIKEVK